MSMRAPHLRVAESNRIDVETSSFDSANSIVVRIVELG